MPAQTPTILATSGGLFPDPRTFFRPAPLLDHALELACPSGRPKLCLINTAGGDQAWWKNDEFNWRQRRAHIKATLKARWEQMGDILDASEHPMFSGPEPI